MSAVIRIQRQENIDLGRILDAARAGKDLPLSKGTTLPPEAYWSEAFFQIEVEKIFLKDWLCVGHVSRLPKVGDYFPIDLLGEMLVVTRAADRVRVLSRICPHRWTPLVNAPGNGSKLQCPFHKWTFGLDGKLLGAPLMDGVDFEAADCRLPEFRSEIINGFIYMSFNEAAPELAPQLAGLSARLAKFRLDELEPGFVVEYDLPINWKIVVETFMECYHHIGAHPQTFERNHPARMSYGEDGEAAWTVVHSPARADVPDEEIASGFPPLGEMTSEERHEFRLYLVYPYHIFILLPDRMGYFCLQPESAMRTRLQSYTLVRPEAKADPGYDAKLEAERGFFMKFNSEDIAVNEMQQRGVRTRSAQPGRWSHLEKACWQLGSYVGRRVSE